MLEDHRGGPRHDSLLKVQGEDDSDSAWMVSYIDIMTLLVALFVIVIVAAEAANPGWLVKSRQPEPVEPPTPYFEVPLPEPLAELREWRKGHESRYVDPGVLNPVAVSAALGVAGLPPRPAPLSSVPPLLAKPSVVQSEDVFVDETQPFILPRLMLPSGFDLQQPLAEFMVVLTDRPPVNVEEINDDAVASAVALEQVLSQRVEESAYLPDLNGVEVSRVAEGINLRVQDQLLFPSSAAELTEDGSGLVDSLVSTIQRYQGEVSVEGHSDSRPINTPEFPSNWALSSARAIAIVEALIEAGVEPSRLRAVGRAATQPLADNESEEGRARNRRVEVLINVE
ncbi:OmpA family protein [Halomonas sp. CH40]